MGKRGILICLIGIDGSGKTTHAKSLVHELESQGIKSRYIWNRYEPAMIRLPMAIVKILLFRGRNINRNSYRDYSTAKKGLFRNRLIATIWHYLVLFDYFPQILLKVKIPLMRGEVIICDRYIYDTIVDRIAESNYPPIEIKKILQSRLLSLIPRPDLVFLLDVPEDIAIQRKKDTISVDYLVERKKAYLNLGKLCKMTILDNSNDFGMVNRLINKKVASYISNEG